MPERRSPAPLLVLAALAAVLPLSACGGDGADGERADRERTGPAPEDRAAIDSVYHRFSRAYDLLEPDSVARLYTQDALYLPAGGEIVRGRDAIRRNFENFFGGLREREASVRISFATVDRQLARELAYDVGYYTIESGTEGSAPATTRGKFTTVWRKEVDGAWRIHVDAFSPAPPGADTVAAEGS